MIRISLIILGLFSFDLKSHSREAERSGAYSINNQQEQEHTLQQTTRDGFATVAGLVVSVPGVVLGAPYGLVKGTIVGVKKGSAIGKKGPINTLRELWGAHPKENGPTAATIGYILGGILGAPTGAVLGIFKGAYRGGQQGYRKTKRGVIGKPVETMQHAPLQKQAQEPNQDQEK